jgi:hypothetical protein
VTAPARARRCHRSSRDQRGSGAGAGDGIGDGLGDGLGDGVGSGGGVGEGVGVGVGVGIGVGVGGGSCDGVASADARRIAPSAMAVLESMNAAASDVASFFICIATVDASRAPPVP